MIVELPSFVDMHVHFREPGFTEKETIESGLQSALRGGYGAVFAMANTNPINDTPEVANFILEKAKKYEKIVDLYPVSAVTKGFSSSFDAKLADFSAMKKAGCIAFSNDGVPVLDKNILKSALMTGELILSHLEDETNEAVFQLEIYKEVLKLSKENLCPIPRLHFCHISKKATIDVIKNAKKEGLNITAETCPHYFTFTKADIDSTGRFKMNPPLGTQEDKLAVTEAIKDGTIDVISTDHAPHTNEEKLMPYEFSPCGITGLETAFSLTYMTFGLELALEKMAYAPRKITGINPKRKIKADLEENWVVSGEKFMSKCKITPYQNMKLKGKIIC